MNQIPTNQEQGYKEGYKLYKRRWIMLLLCFFLIAINEAQTLQYVVVAHIITEYYNVTYVSVTWTSLVFIINSGCLSPFAGYIIKKVNLRNTILLSLVILCLSSWIRLLSVSPERFWILIFTQTLASLSVTILAVVPAVLSSNWFGPNEISFSCSILKFGSLLSSSTTAILCQELIHRRSGNSSIERGLYALPGITIVITTILLIFMFFFFKDKPPTPPTEAQFQKRENHKTIDFKESIKQMALISSFWRFLIAYCISTTTAGVILMFINRNILELYPEADMDVGRISALAFTMGMIGVILTGYAIGKLQHFKAIIITLYGCGALSMFAYTFLLEKGMLYAYIVSGIFGLFILTPSTTIYDMSAELCYPVDESLSGSIAILFTQLLIAPSIYAYTALLDNVGIKTTNLIVCGCMVFGFGLLCSVRFDLKRRKVNEGSNENK